MVRVSLKSRVSVPEEVLFHELAGEGIILHQETGKYYGLDEVGTRMWVLVTHHGTLEPALRELLEEYDVTEEQLRHDLLAWVEELASHDLLEIDDA
jgi:hypothetical protein